jgi:hypothetical protein
VGFTVPAVVAALGSRVLFPPAARRDHNDQGRRMNELMTVPPVQIGAWLACLAFTVMLANGLVKLWASVRGKPAPGEISERLTKLETISDLHAKRLKDLEKNDKELRELFIAENTKIYNRVNQIAETLYTLVGKVEAVLKNGGES